MEKITDISLKTLIRECSLDKQEKDKHKEYFDNEVKQIIGKIFRYKKFQDNFTEKLTCYGKKEHIIGLISPSYDCFIKSLKYALNIENEDTTEEELTQVLLDRVKVLKSIKSEKELKNQFPKLYQDLIEGRKYYKLTKMLELEGINQKEVKERNHYFYSCGLKRSLDNFIKTQAEMYTRYISKRLEYKDELTKIHFNQYVKNNFDLNKLYMYTTHELLLICENAKSISKIKNYLDKIIKFLSLPNFDKSTYIITDDKELIDIDNIKKRYEEIVKKVKNSCTMVNWVLVKEGETYTKYQTDITRNKLVLKNNELDQLRKIGREKDEFYKKTDYIAKVVGLKLNSGYVGYIYENGEVILDMPCSEKHPKKNKGNAIYNLKIANFQVLSQLDKQKLKECENVKRIIHRNNWEEKVMKIVNRKALPEEKEATLQFIKKMKSASNQ